MLLLNLLNSFLFDVHTLNFGVCHIQWHWMEKIHFQGNASHAKHMAFCWERTPDAPVRSLHLLPTKSWNELDWEGKGTQEVSRWFVGRCPGNDYNRDPSPALCPVIPHLPKQPAHSQGQGCGFRPEVCLDGVGATLDWCSTMGVARSWRSRRQRPAKGSHRRTRQEESRSSCIVLSAGIEKRGSAQSWCFSQLWWSQGSCPGSWLVCLRHRASPGPAVMVCCCQHFPGSWRAKSFPVSFDEAKSRPGPWGSPFPPLFLVSQAWDMLMLLTSSLAFPMGDEMMKFNPSNLDKAVWIFTLPPIPKYLQVPPWHQWTRVQLFPSPSLHPGYLDLVSSGWSPFQWCPPGWWRVLVCWVTLQCCL